MVQQGLGLLRGVAQVQELALHGPALRIQVEVDAPNVFHLLIEPALHHAGALVKHVVGHIGLVVASNLLDLGESAQILSFLLAMAGVG